MAALLNLIGIGVPLATSAFNALEKIEPDIAKLISALPAPMTNAVSAVAPNNGVGVEASVAANLSKAMPAATATEYGQIKTMIGNAVAVYMTSNPSAQVTSGAAWDAIVAAAKAGVATLGLDVSKIPSNTITQMVSSGIEMYLAGVGTRPIKVA